MSCRAKAIITLVLIAPILTEIVSGNTPPHALLHPSISLFLLAAYSLPLLVIRELSVRWRRPTAGIFVLGLGYGILNEGLLAQTLIRFDNVPISNFDRYAYAGGVNYSWAFLILPWHALLAVVFPLTLVACWFPSCARTRWLSRPTFAVLAAILIAGIAFISLVRQPHPQMRAFLLTIAILVAGASIFRNKEQNEYRTNARSIGAFILGLIFYVTFVLGAIVLATIRVPPALFFTAVVVILFGFGWLSHRYEFDRLPDAANVAQGSYFVASCFNLTAGVVRHSLETMISAGLLACVFLVLARRVRLEPVEKTG